jgi:mannose-6-phosphate isomerase-like protein (cupin superfamily)
MTRRVVTGLDAQGRSAVILDGPVPGWGDSGGRVWRTTSHPADNSVQADCPDEPFSFDLMHSGGSVAMIHTFPAGAPDFWHATDSIDYIVMLEGEVVLQLEANEVTLRAGDVLVDRGVIHSWRNDTGQPARAFIVAMPALPVGKGRTV